MWKEHAKATKRSLDGSAPSVHPGGRPPALNPEHIEALHDIVMERAQTSLQEIADELQRRCGVRVCAATIRRALRSQEIVRLKPVRRVFTKSPAKGAKRYGYTAAHRREDVSPYSTNLTDAEWDLVADMLLAARKLINRRDAKTLLRNASSRPFVTALVSSAVRGRQRHWPSQLAAELPGK